MVASDVTVIWLLAVLGQSFIASISPNPLRQLAGWCFLGVSLSVLLGVVLTGDRIVQVSDLAFLLAAFVASIGLIPNVWRRDWSSFKRWCWSILVGLPLIGPVSYLAFSRHLKPHGFDPPGGL